MASDPEREDLVQAAKQEQQASQSAKPRVRRAPRPDGAAPSLADAGQDAAESAVPATEAEEGDAPRKRRRRRRKPGAGGAGGDAVGGE